MSGELHLSMTYPLFKRRYGVSTDIHVGCRIGCEFCYYRFGPLSPLFGAGAKLKAVATPAMYWKMLRGSKLVRKGDIILYCARSDFSMPENRFAFSEFLEYYDPQIKPLIFLVLQRAPYLARDWFEFKDAPVVFGSTITPDASLKEFNRIRDDKQIRGLTELRDAGCPPERISLELGPILPDTVNTAIEIAQYLAQAGIVSFLTYRGSSLGEYGDYREAHKTLKSKGFWQEKVPYTYFDGKEDCPHEYYILKNYLAEETEQRFLFGVQNLPIRFYRHTGHLYFREFGVQVSPTRNNRVRNGMLGYTTPKTVEQVQAELDNQFGIRCEIEAIGQDATGNSPVFLLHRQGTEDIAHAIGKELGVGILFSRFNNQPTLEDLEWYYREGWIVEL